MIGQWVQSLLAGPLDEDRARHNLGTCPQKSKRNYIKTTASTMTLRLHQHSSFRKNIIIDIKVRNHYIGYLGYDIALNLYPVAYML